MSTILSRLTGPGDLRALDDGQLAVLAAEIRETIVRRSSAASSVSWASVRPRRSAGPVSVGRIAIWSAPGAVCGLALHRRAAEWTLDLGRL